MEMYSIIGPLSSLAGCLSVWMSSSHQSVLRRPIPRRFGYVAGGVLILGGGCILYSQMQAVAAIFLLMTWVMVWGVILPYLGGLFSLLWKTRS